MRTFATVVVAVGGNKYVIFALKTASAGAALLTEPVWFPTFVKYKVSGVDTANQWPWSPNPESVSFDACPGGSTTSARKSLRIAAMISLAVVCWTLDC
jgi:hypothetical protein